jgi:dsDNA-binding SOS-regulon protein
MLELAEMVGQVLEKNITGLSENQAEEIGIFLAKHRAIFASAFKSNVEALAELK